MKVISMTCMVYIHSVEKTISQSILYAEHPPSPETSNMHVEPITKVL